MIQCNIVTRNHSQHSTDLLYNALLKNIHCTLNLQGIPDHKNLVPNLIFVIDATDSICVKFPPGVKLCILNAKNAYLTYYGYFFSLFLGVKF